ncbi:TonB-dependent receptor [Novimethylophilus kurashikiensis]|uniref:TonB-dependent receptor n=1 Tax=Novimethylophilus kurashikiensis TaxID=1825523 RepID=A0A2R5FCU8_9PROT|nr:hypothetical protein [Novimethylophilus kurashikiensis]GBG15388.1 TonB-dependent receptor [Novimethylophilus kurashikiensis]
MARIPLKEAKRKRDGANGAVLLVPHVVLNSPAYLTLSGNAIKLLYDVAMQYNLTNNGMLLASWRYMSEKRGWTSSEALSKAKAELIAHDLLVQTVQGLRPNKASWYGLTWYALDDIKGLEISPQAWPRGAYAHWKPPVATKPKRIPPAPQTREAHYQRMRNPPLEKNTTSCP